MLDQCFGKRNFGVIGNNALRELKTKILHCAKPRLGNLNQYAPKGLTQQRVPKIKVIANPPTISLVTPSYAQGKYIEQTIQSILNQNYPKLDYFIQDGASTDETLSIIKGYEHQLQWQSKPDKGQTQAINWGFTHSQGEIMAYLNSDDLLLPGTLAYVAEYFNKHPNIDVIYGNRLIINEEGQEVGRWMLPKHNNAILSWVDFVPQETLFWRRRIWDKIGGQLDESFQFAMDWDLLVRFREAGAKFAHIPLFLGAFRVHKSQKTSQMIHEIGFEEMSRIRKRALGRIPSNEEIRKAIFPYILKHQVIDLAFALKIRFKAGPDQYGK
jgi:glycosyltransferase involved in cell wall biosynthesis